MNDSQRMAIMHGEGPLLVTAGPGSGKTTVIIGRLLYLIEEKKIPPENILVITFTKEAAISMSSRFNQISQQNNMCESLYLRNVSFSTFHSFFYQILRSDSKYSQYKIIDSSTQNRIVAFVLKECMKEEVPYEWVIKMQSAFGYYKNTLNFAEAKKKLSETLQTVYDQAYQAYSDILAERKWMDYDDLQMLCYRLLRNNSKTRDVWQERFPYLLIDEFQDCNPIQYEIVSLLVTSPYNVFAVGDDDQAIYGFRGADFEIMNRFIREYPMTGIINLDINYRSNEEIVMCSNKVIEKNKRRIAKKLRSNKQTNVKSVYVKGFTSSGEQMNYLLQQLEGESNEVLEKKAVLFRTNYAISSFVLQLIKRKIPFHMEEKVKSPYEHFIVRDIMGYLSQSGNSQWDSNVLLRVLECSGIVVSRDAFLNRRINLEQLKKYYRESYMEDKKIVFDICMFEEKVDCLYKLPVDLGIRYIKNALGYERYLYRKSSGDKILYDEWMSILKWLEEETGQFRNIEEWKQYQEEVIKIFHDENGKDRKYQKGIHILTMHAAKGLEFDKVYIPDLNEGNIPKARHGQILGEKELEEERRLFYVGITRAKEVLELLYLVGTKEHPKPPSRFLQVLLKQ